MHQELVSCLLPIAGVMKIGTTAQVLQGQLQDVFGSTLGFLSSSCHLIRGRPLAGTAYA